MLSPECFRVAGVKHFRLLIETPEPRISGCLTRLKEIFTGIKVTVSTIFCGQLSDNSLLCIVQKTGSPFKSSDIN